MIETEQMSLLNRVLTIDLVRGRQCGI